MKKIILLLAIVGFFAQAHAQKLLVTEVPAAVVTAFYKAYPTIQDVNWNQDGLNYEAGYQADQVANSATYDVSGILVQTQVEIVNSALPAPAMDYVKINYKENDIKKAFKITDASNIVTYEAEVQGMDLTFTSEGTFINSIKK